MTDASRQVFISYAWGGESERIVDELEADLQASGIRLVRDKRDLPFRGRIRDFMQKIGQGAAVIVIISDRYLKSPNCMYELVEIARQRDIHDRIFPIVLADADIYNPVNRIKYIRHWEEKYRELDEAMKTVSSANLHGLREEMDSYDEIRDSISNLTFLLKDMNALTPEMHENSNFQILIAAIQQRLKEEGPEVPAHPSRKPEPVRSSGPARGSEYKTVVLKRLGRDEYQELPEERLGELQPTHVLEKNVRFFFNTLNEYHRFVICEEQDLSEDRYLELEKEIKRNSRELGSQRSAYVHTLCLILTRDVSEELAELIRRTRPASYALTDMGSHAIVVYSTGQRTLYHPATITESHESRYSEKIRDYLIP